MAHEPWLVFGLDGRTAADINSAVELGYRRFDTAESYRTPDGGSTTAALEAAVKNLRRDEYEVLSKINLHDNESVQRTKKRVTDIAEQFGGKLDAVLIHNLGEASEDTAKRTWNALHELKREGVIKRAGVGNIIPQNAQLVDELSKQNKFDVVDFSPSPSPANSQQGSDKGSPKMEASKQSGNDSDSDDSSRIFGAVENSASSVLADPELREMLQKLSADTDLYYYNVLRTLNSVNDHHKRQNSGAELGLSAHAGAGVITEMINYTAPGGINMILSSGTRETQKANLDAFRHDNLDYALLKIDNPQVMMDAQRAVNNWAMNQKACDRNGASLPQNVRDKLQPLFDDAGAQRAEAHKWIASQGMSVNREGVSQWLMKERGFERLELEGHTVPDRVGLRAGYRDMRIADVMSAQFGTQNCNYKWADQLAAPLLRSAQDWRDAGLKEVLTEIATPVNSAPSSTRSRSESPKFQVANMANLSLSDSPGRAAASSAGGNDATQAARVAQKPPAQGPRR